MVIRGTSSVGSNEFTTWLHTAADKPSHVYLAGAHNQYFTGPGLVCPFPEVFPAVNRHFMFPAEYSSLNHSGTRRFPAGGLKCPHSPPQPRFLNSYAGSQHRNDPEVLRLQNIPQAKMTLPGTCTLYNHRN